MLLLSLSFAVISVRLVRSRPGATGEMMGADTGAGAVRFEAGVEQRTEAGEAKNWVRGFPERS